jgi:hypothetical protein
MNDERAWADARRVESWAGEFRINLIRLIAIAGFYGYHLLDTYLLRPDDEEIVGRYHTQITILALAWAVGALAMHLYLVNRWVPAALKYIATAWDLVMVTALLMIGQDPHNLLTALYVVVIAAAALRLDLTLIYGSTMAGMLAFLFFHGYIRYWLEFAASRRLSHAQQTLFLLALVVTGLIAGQVVRQARRLAQGHAVTVLYEESK